MSGQIAATELAAIDEGDSSRSRLRRLRGQAVEELGEGFEIAVRVGPCAGHAAEQYDLLQEITDLYGAPPAEVENLVQIMLIKQRLGRLGALGLEYGGKTKTCRRASRSGSIPRARWSRRSSSCAVAGLVSDAAGGPVAGAEVVAEDASSAYGSAGLARVETAGDGRWRIAALAGGTYRFAASHPSYSPAASALVTVDSVSPRDVVITMAEGGRVAGRVVSKTGEGAPFALVRAGLATEAGSESLRQAHADAMGAFTMAGLPRRLVHLAAIHDTGSSPAVAVDLAAAPTASGVVLTLEREGADCVSAAFSPSSVSERARRGSRGSPSLALVAASSIVACPG